MVAQAKAKPTSKRRKKQDNDDDELTEQERVLDRARAIIHRLNMLATEQVRLRQPIETRWLEDLRQYYGKYDDKTDKQLEDEARSRAFVKLTRHKTNGWAARLSDLLFPTDGKNWGIEPTPLPTLADAAKKAIAAAKESVEGANAAAQKANPQAEAMMLEQANAYARKAQLTKEEMDAAKERCTAMEKAIEDQLVECNYVAECRDVIEDGCRLGTGILKGPLTSQKLRREWRETGIVGHWELAEIPDPMPEFKRVDVWHFFPDMSAGRIREAEFTFERHLPTKKDLRRMALKLGFSKAGVRRLLEEGPGMALENIDSLTALRGMVDGFEAIKDRYIMWEYHGALECDEVAILLHATDDTEAAEDFERNKDPFEEYRVILYFCNNELLKIAPEYPLDSGDTLYSVWNFEKGETSIFGIGVPNIMADSQSAINGAWRMMLDNSALSVGPQIVMDKTSVTPQTAGDYRLKPLKVWLRSSTANMGAQNKPFEIFNIENNQQQIGGIIEIAKAFIDEEVSMPDIAQGEQGAASKTLGGMSMLFNSANVVFRRVVKSFDDDLTAPTLRRAYDWNMQFNPDDSVKGDMQVDAKGTSVLLVREIQSQNLLNIVTNWSVHQTLAPWIKVREAMTLALQTMLIKSDDVLKTQDEYDREQEIAAQNAEQQPPSAEEIKLQIAELTNNSRLQIAELTEQSRQAVANMQLQGLMAKLQEETGMSRAELEAKYGLEQIKIESAERRHAVDIAVEDRRAKEAVAEGGNKVDARGQGVG